MVLTKSHYDAALELYLRWGNSPTKVARRLKIPFDDAVRLFEQGISPECPPILPILRAKLDTQKSVKLGQNAPPMQPMDGAPSEIHQIPHKPQVSEILPELLQDGPPPLKLAPAPKATPNEPSSLQTGDTAADLARALDNVHRDLALALGRESRLVGAFREQAIGLASGATKSVQAFDAIIGRLTDKLTLMAQRGELLEERRAFSVLTKLARITRTAAEAGERAIKLQRLIAGLPQTITADLSPGATPDRVADLAAITDRLEALQSARRARVIDIDASPYKGEESGEG